MNAGDWKRKIFRELINYGILSLYLALVFGLFAWYRRLVLAEYQITYLHYGESLIEALILGKLIIVGDHLRLGRRFDDNPLIISTLFKAFVFSLFVAAFTILEHMADSLLHGKGLLNGFYEIIHEGSHEIFGRCMIMFVAFIPLFAFKELERILGEQTIGILFFTKKRPDRLSNSRS
jgi:hypothetical protein